MEFFTSDTHFGHANILTYCQRPFESVGHMNEEMIRRWNARVGVNDTVYHLGDFAMGPKDLWYGYRQQLKGRIVFLLGNHDEPFERWKAEVLLPGDEVYEHLLVRHSNWGDFSLSHEPLDWKSVRDDGQVVRAGVNVEADYFLCGHIHNAWREKNVNGYWCINVGVDKWDFYPHTLFEILSRSEVALK